MALTTPRYARRMLLALVAPASLLALTWMLALLCGHAPLLLAYWFAMSQPAARLRLQDELEAALEGVGDA